MKKAKILAAVMAASLMAGTIPVSPIADFFDRNITTASAETNGTQWNKDSIHGAIDNWSISSVVFLDHKPENGTVKTAVSVSSDDSIVAGPASDTSGIMYIWSADGGKVIAPANCSSLFYGINQLTSIDLSGLDTSNVTNMDYMFYGCSALTEIDLSSFDTSKVPNMSYMFSNCGALTKIDLSKFNTSNVTNMGYMFYGCSALTEIVLRCFDTSKVINMEAMFCGCKALTKLDLSSFDTSNVTDMSAMFGDCKALTKLDITNFYINYSTDIGNFHRACTSLTTVVCYADTYEKLGFDSNKVKRIVPDVVEKYYVDGYSVDIENGSFTLNVYMDLPGEFSNNKNAFVRFNLPNGTKSDIPVEIAEVKELNNKYYLVFSVPVAAKDMAKDVKVEIFTDENKKITGDIIVSVKKYAKTLAKTTPEYEPFVKSMLNYGEFASNYFNPTDNFEGSYDLATLKVYAGKITASAGINTPNYVGSSLLLKDKIILRHYFNTKVDGATQKGDLWYVEKAFNPTEFDRKIEGYDYTVNNYLKKVLEGNYDYNLKYLCCALYEYSQAASKLGKN